MKALFYTFLFTFITIPLGLADSLSIEVNNSANKVWEDTVAETWKGKYINLRSTKNKSSPIDELRCSEDHGSRLSIAYSYKIKMSYDVCLKLFEELKIKDLKKLNLFFSCSSEESCELISFKDLNPSVIVSVRKLESWTVSENEDKSLFLYSDNNEEASTHLKCANRFSYLTVDFNKKSSTKVFMSKSQCLDMFSELTSDVNKKLKVSFGCDEESVCKISQIDSL